MEMPEEETKKKRANQTNTTTGALGAEWEMGLEEEREKAVVKAESGQQGGKRGAAQHSSTAGWTQLCCPQQQVLAAQQVHAAGCSFTDTHNLKSRGDKKKRQFLTTV